MSSENINNQLSVKFPDEIGDKVREVAKRQVRSVNNAVIYLVKLGLDQLDLDKLENAS